MARLKVKKSEECFLEGFEGYGVIFELFPEVNFGYCNPVVGSGGFGLYSL